MASSLDKDQSEIKSISWYRYVINGRKGIRNGLCQAIHQHVNANTKYMADNDKNKELPYPKY